MKSRFDASRKIKAPTGTTLSAENWQTEKNNPHHSGAGRNPEIQVQTKFIVFDFGGLAVMNRNAGETEGSGCLDPGLRRDDGLLSLDGAGV